MSATASRHGVWLLMVAFAPAARGLRPALAAPGNSTRRPSPLGAGATAAAVVLIAMGLFRGPTQTGASVPLLRASLKAASGAPILAEGILGEQVAAAGGKVWIANPLDAFRSSDQRWYIRWAQNGSPALIPSDTDVVLVVRDGTPALLLRHDPAYRVAARDARAILFLRR